MSRVGKMPIALPQGVDVSLSDDQISVKGALGTLVQPVNALVTVKNEAGRLMFTPANDSPEANAMSGTLRALVANMVSGVSKGFEKKLSLVGVGFRSQFWTHSHALPLSCTLTQPRWLSPPKSNLASARSANTISDACWKPRAPRSRCRNLRSAPRVPKMGRRASRTCGGSA